MKKETKNLLDKLKKYKEEVKRLENKTFKLIRWDLIPFAFIGSTKMYEYYKKSSGKDHIIALQCDNEDVRKGYILTISADIDDCEKLSFIEKLKGRGRYVLHYKDDREPVKKTISEIKVIYENKDVFKSLIEYGYPFTSKKDIEVANEYLCKLQEKYFV